MIKRKKKPNKEEINRRNDFFLSIWKSRPHKSEVSGSKLYEPVSSVYFHHIFPKNKYPQAEYDPENVILLTWEEHDTVEMNPTKYEEINRRRDNLFKKYSI